MAKFSKLLNIILWGLMVISVILLISLIVNVSPNEADQNMSRWINTNMLWALILLIVVGTLAVFAAIFQSVTDKKARRGGLITLVLAVAVILIAYLLAKGTMPQFLGVDKFIESGILTPRSSKWIDTGLNTAYILFLAAILSLIVAPLIKRFTNR